MPLLQSVQRLAVKKLPEIRPGYTVKVYQKIKEGEKERIQVYEGLVIAINSGHGADKTITVRKVVEGIGVEKIFPLFSTNIDKIEVMKKAHVRRAKLYYMRERSGKSARLKEVHVTAEERRQSMKEDEVAVKEEPTVTEETPVETAEVVETTPVAEAPEVTSSDEEAVKEAQEEVAAEAPAAPAEAQEEAPAAKEEEAKKEEAPAAKEEEKQA